MSRRRTVFLGLAFALVLAAVVSPFASTAPDGLERVAQDQGFAAEGPPAWGRAPLRDYQVPGVTHPGLATSLAGVIGTLTVFLAAVGVGRWLRRPSPPTSP